MRKDILVVGTIIIVLALMGVAQVVQTTIKNPGPDGGVCTMDAKECPDGSYVGRVPPSCEFAACPGASSTPSTGGGQGIAPYHSGIRGVVLLGPTCPVVKNP